MLQYPGTDKVLDSGGPEGLVTDNSPGEVRGWSLGGVSPWVERGGSLSSSISNPSSSSSWIRLLYWPLDPEAVVLGLPMKLGARLIVTFNLKGENFTLNVHSLYTGQIIKGEPVRVHSAARLS